MKCVLGVLATLWVLTAGAAQNYVYELDQFPVYASMSVSVKDPNQGAREAVVKMKASYFGMAVGDLTEVSSLNEDGRPLLDSRCRNPKDSNRNYNCYSTRFDQEELLYKGFNGLKPVLSDALTAGDSGVKTFKYTDYYTSLDQEDISSLPLHNASSLFLLIFRPDFGVEYDGRIFFVTGNEEFFRVRFHVTRQGANALDIRFEPMNGGQASASLPGRLIYDINAKKVTSIYFTVKNKEYVLRAKN